MKRALSILCVCLLFTTSCMTIPENSDIKYKTLKNQIDIMYKNTKLLVTDVNKTDKAEQFLWAIGLSGMLSVRNNQNISSLSPEKDTSRIQLYIQVLKRDWGINNKKDLLENISWCVYVGHSQAFSTIENRIITNPKITYTDLINEGINITTNQFQMVSIFSEYTRERSLHAWDYGRAIWLARIGFYTGFISEDEAINIINFIANRMLGEYNSWEDYGANYCIGRIFWGGMKYRISTLSAYKDLVSDKGFLCHIKWINKIDSTVKKQIEDTETKKRI